MALSFFAWLSLNSPPGHLESFLGPRSRQRKWEGSPQAWQELLVQRGAKTPDQQAHQQGTQGVTLSHGPGPQPGGETSTLSQSPMLGAILLGTPQGPRPPGKTRERSRYFLRRKGRGGGRVQGRLCSVPPSSISRLSVRVTDGAPWSLLHLIFK